MRLFTCNVLGLAQLVGSLLPEDEVPDSGCLLTDVTMGMIFVPAELSTRKAHSSSTATINMQICNGNWASLPFSVNAVQSPVITYESR